MFLWANPFAATNTIPTLTLDGERNRRAQEIPLELILPSMRDSYSVPICMEVIVGRILCGHFMHFMAYYKDCEVAHIPHQYNKELAKKTPIVS